MLIIIVKIVVKIVVKTSILKLTNIAMALIILLPKHFMLYVIH